MAGHLDVEPHKFTDKNFNGNLSQAPPWSSANSKLRALRVTVKSNVPTKGHCHHVASSNPNGFPDPDGVLASRRGAECGGRKPYAFLQMQHHNAHNEF